VLCTYLHLVFKYTSTPILICIYIYLCKYMCMYVSSLHALTNGVLYVGPTVWALGASILDPGSRILDPASKWSCCKVSQIIFCWNYCKVSQIICSWNYCKVSRIIFCWRYCEGPTNLIFVVCSSHCPLATYRIASKTILLVSCQGVHRWTSCGAVRCSTSHSFSEPM
jgi:hypothetical protein